MQIAPHYLQSAAKSPVLNLSFNGSGSIFASAETDGWRAWDSESLKQVASKESPNGSLSIVLPLDRTNIIFLVGGPPSPLYSPNKVIVFCIDKDTAIASIEFDSAVLGLALRRDRLAVVLIDRVVLFALPKGPAEIIEEGSFETFRNRKGLVALATFEHSTLLAIPGRQSGLVSMVRLPPLHLQQGVAVSSRPPGEQPFPSIFILLAHESALSALTCTTDGSLIATSSIKGTLVRVWDGMSGKLMREVRRGTDLADIFSLALRPDGLALACASDKGTIHLWSFESRPEKQEHSADAEAVKVKPFLPKYFSSAWSHGQFRLPPPEAQQARTLPFLDQFAEEKRDKPVSVDEDPVHCCWVKTTGDDDTDETYRYSRKGKSKRKETVGPQHEYVLICVARSGGYFKLGLRPSSLSDSEKKQQKESLDSLGYGATGRCELVEFKRFEQSDW